LFTNNRNQKGEEAMQVMDAVNHKVVSEREWLEASKAFLAKEKALTRQRDALSRERRELPWVKVEKNYVFDGPKGKQTLAELFDGRSQLVIYHFMFGPEWEAGCPSCSLVADGFEGSLAHVVQRDVTPVVVSRAPLSKIEAFQKHLGWGFHWVSSFGNDFNRDYRVSFTKDEMEEMANGKAYYNFETSRHPVEEAQGISVFYKDASGDIFHTYSSYGRGVEVLMSAYSLLDLAPKGRDEEGLSFPMAWVKHHDKYENSPKAAGHSCCSAESHP
jgi:predicted dithiol-disulfide oxidoreductase (DUF899 family)